MDALIATEEGNNPTWRSKRGDIPLSKMDNDYLQKAKTYSQQRELHFHNKQQIFVNLIDELDAEAERRGIKLKEIDEVNSNIGTYFSQKRRVRKSSKEARELKS